MTMSSMSSHPHVTLSSMSLHSSICCSMSLHSSICLSKESIIVVTTSKWIILSPRNTDHFLFTIVCTHCPLPTLYSFPILSFALILVLTSLFGIGYIRTMSLHSTSSPLSMSLHSTSSLLSMSLHSIRRFLSLSLNSFFTISCCSWEFSFFPQAVHF